MKWNFASLDQSFSLKDFDCGNSQLNDYLKKYASQNQKRGYSITIVATLSGEKKVVGYYCASASVIEFVNIPDSLNQRLPRYPAPAMLIGQLAVDKNMQGQGLGESLLMHALARAVRISTEMGIFAVRVDASNQDAKRFYLKYGFVPFENVQLSLLLPIATIEKSRR